MNYRHDLDIFRLRRAYMGELGELPAPMREAKLFQKFIEMYPVHIEPNDLFAGWYGFETFEDMLAAYPPEPEGMAVKLPHEKEDFGKLPRIDSLVAYGFRPGGYDGAHHENKYRDILARGKKFIERFKVEEGAYS